MSIQTVLCAPASADRSPTTKNEIEQRTAPCGREPKSHDLVGASFGHFKVLEKHRTRRRWVYRVIDTRTGKDVRNVHGAPARLAGNELVKLARQAEAEGLRIIIPNGEPWVSHD